jgi:alpha-tubulin suppressor-like RCC1 family protein
MRLGAGHTRSRHDRRLLLPLVAIGAALTLAGSAPAPASAYGVAAWGSDEFGQLGNGSRNENAESPVLVRGLQRGAGPVAAGADHSLALRGGGGISAWGSNETGQLGDGTTEDSDVPLTVSGLSAATAISAGYGFSLALPGNGTVMAWGNNASGQLGDGSFTRRQVPAAVRGLSTVTAIAAGANFSLALLSNGTVMAWGNNAAGQLGNGSFTSSNVPVEVRKLGRATAIAAGAHFGLALMSDGTVMAWGENKRGQLGNGSFTGSNVPVAVGRLSAVTAISAGADFSLALLSNGTVMAWGNNAAGQLGDGTTTSADLPEHMQKLHAATAISAGGNFSLALRSDGRVMASGANADGQLGTGNTKSHLVPVVLRGLSGVVGISAGYRHSLAYGSLIPTVTKVSPAGGPTSGGTSVGIVGTNLMGASAVEFGSTMTSSFTVNSASSITATAPPGNGTVDVLVSTPAGTSSSAAADRYTYEAGASSTPYRGVNSHAPWYWQVSEAQVKREIAEAAALGVDFIRVPVEWAEIESGGEGVRGGKALARLDLIVNEAAAFGIKIDGTIATTPHWASPGGAWNDAPAEADRSLRGFARFLTQRYGTKLLALGVLNEPNWEENLKTPRGEYLPLTEEGLKRRAYWYVKDAKAVFAGAREGNAAVKVLAGETAGADKGNALIFLKACFEGGLPHGEGSSQSGFKGFYHAIAAHVYADGRSPEYTGSEHSTKGRIERLHTFLQEREGSNPVPVWATEWGYSIEDSESVRAEYVERGVRMLDEQFAYLEGWAYYQLRDTVDNPTDKEENFGLLHYGFQPRLSFAAFEAGMLAG